MLHASHMLPLCHHQSPTPSCIARQQMLPSSALLSLACNAPRCRGRPAGCRCPARRQAHSVPGCTATVRAAGWRPRRRFCLPRTTLLRATPFTLQPVLPYQMPGTPAAATALCSTTPPSSCCCTAPYSYHASMSFTYRRAINAGRTQTWARCAAAHQHQQCSAQRRLLRCCDLPFLTGAQESKDWRSRGCAKHSKEWHSKRTSGRRGMDRVVSPQSLVRSGAHVGSMHGGSRPADDHGLQ